LPHGVRDGSCAVPQAAGADLKDIQEMLGHSPITSTADT
jgi:site-specific recombinase XerD